MKVQASQVFVLSCPCACSPSLFADSELTSVGKTARRMAKVVSKNLPVTPVVKQVARAIQRKGDLELRPKRNRGDCENGGQASREGRQRRDQRGNQDHDRQYRTSRSAYKIGRLIGIYEEFVSRGAEPTCFFRAYRVQEQHFRCHSLHIGAAPRNGTVLGFPRPRSGQCPNGEGGSTERSNVKPVA